jgi:hypothetical protein
MSRKKENKDHLTHGPDEKIAGRNAAAGQAENKRKVESKRKNQRDFPAVSWPALTAALERVSDLVVMADSALVVTLQPFLLRRFGLRTRRNTESIPGSPIGTGIFRPGPAFSVERRGPRSSR